MRKTFVIAAREYSAAVKTKAFLIGLLIMPLLMGGSVIMQEIFKDIRDTKDKHFVVIDRTPNAAIVPELKKALDLYNLMAVEGGKQVRARMILHEEPPSEPEEQRYQLSERCRKGDLFGFLDIGPKVLNAIPELPSLSLIGKGKLLAGDDDSSVRYQSNRPTFGDFAFLAEQVVNAAALNARAKQFGISDKEVRLAALPVPLQNKGLTTRDPLTGKPKDATDSDKLATFLVPFVLIMLMFMVMMMGATPLMQGVVEEKMQRIAEVLLGSVSPFQLMMGKLVGMTAVSLTIVGVYLVGGYWAAHRFGVSEHITPGLILSFLVFQTLAALMFGSLFIAVGAACSDMKETQNLLLPVMLLACLPMFVLMNVLTEPNGPVATGMSFFPFATPTLMIARMAIPPGVPWWQPIVGGLLVLATTGLCVFAAGRIFRVGILMQGKGARLGELARWVLRG